MSIFGVSAWFIAGFVAAAIVVAALLTSSALRNGALVLAGCALVVIVFAGGAEALTATADMLGQHIRATPEFSHGLIAALLLSAVLALGSRPRSQ